MSIDLPPDRRPAWRTNHAVRRRAWRCALAWLCVSWPGGCASVTAEGPAERVIADPAPATRPREPATQSSPPAAQAERQPNDVQPLEQAHEPNPATAVAPDGAPPVLSGEPATAASDPALSLAAFEGDLSRVRKLVQDGADLEARDRYGGTPLMAALRKFAAESKVSGARAGRTEKDRQRAARKLRVAHLLIERGADVRASDRLGHTPLHFAAMADGDEREVVAVLDALIARGASVDRRTDELYRRTPLEYAVEQGMLGRVECLLRHGADAGVVTAEGKSLQAIAEERGYGAIAQLLRAAAPR